jgi:hypothetical protein
MIIILLTILSISCFPVIIMIVTLKFKYMINNSNFVNESNAHDSMTGFINFHK